MGSRIASYLVELRGGADGFIRGPRGNVAACVGTFSGQGIRASESRDGALLRLGRDRHAHVASGHERAEHRRGVPGTAERIRRRVRTAALAPYGTAGAARG